MGEAVSSSGATVAPPLSGPTVPVSTASGMVSTSSRPSGGTRHRRILASSPAAESKGSSLLGTRHLESPCSRSRLEDLPPSPVPSLLTHGKAVGVKGVPGQIGHSCPILKRRQCCVRQAAGLLQLWEVPQPRVPLVTGRAARQAACLSLCLLISDTPLLGGPSSLPQPPQVLSFKCQPRGPRK